MSGKSRALALAALLVALTAAPAETAAAQSYRSKPVRIIVASAPGGGADFVARPIMRELIALARAKPGLITYGSTGSGAIIHLATALFEHIAGITIDMWRKVVAGGHFNAKEIACS